MIAFLRIGVILAVIPAKAGIQSWNSVTHGES